jgi:hypothetical protein
VSAKLSPYPDPKRVDDPARVGAALFSTEQTHVDGHALAEQYDPTPDPYVNDPVGWITAHGGFMWSKQEEVAASLVANRYTAVHSCHGTGKSFDASALACWWLAVHPAGEAFVVTTAPTWNQVHAILWREMRKLHKSAGLPGRLTLDARWYMGDGSRKNGTSDEELVAYGRKPSDYDQSAFQGIHARYVLVIIDEAGGVPKLLYDAVDSLVTNDNSRVLAIGNPDDPSSQFQKVCEPGTNWNTIHISYDMTPAFTGEDVPEWLLELLISETWVEERKTNWGEQSPTYVSKVLGEFPDVSDDTLLSPALLLRCQINELKGNETGTYGADIARMGADETCVYRNRGGKIRLVYSKHKQDTVDTTKDFERLIKDRNKEVPMQVDADGLGAGVYDSMARNGMPVIEFRGGRKPFDQKRFVNRKAEVFWTFKVMCEDGEVDLPAHGEDDDLISQLGSIKWSLDSKGKIGIESKEDMKKRGLPSPDRADACVMSAINTAGLRLSTKKMDRNRKRGKGKGKRAKPITKGIRQKAM